MTNSEKRRLDVIIAWVGMVVTAATVLISVFVGLYQFKEGELNKIKLENQLLLQKDKIAFQRQLWLERLSTYRKVAETAGAIIANAGDAKKAADSIAQFTSIYWGTMIFVQDKTVEEPMIEFAIALRDYEKGWRSLDELKLKANSLIEACHKSVATGKASLQP